LKAAQTYARGADHYAIAWRLAAGAWLACALLQLILYLRPSPYGGPFLVRWATFIIRPLLYEMLSVWLIAFPFFLLWLILYDRGLSSTRWRLLHWLLAVLMGFNLLVTAFDHELYRFLGLRLGPNFLDVYGDPDTLDDSLFLNVLRGDRGGPFLSVLLCIAAPGLYSWWAARTVRRRSRTLPPQRYGFRVATLILIMPFAVGLNAYVLAKAKFRLSRLEPAPFAMIRDFNLNHGDDAPPGDPRALAGAWQREWLAASGEPGWRYPDPAWPYLKVPANPAAPGPNDRWNVILIQLESVRGVDTGHLRPDRAMSATPYLDTLAARPDAAVWTRAMSFGPPSLNGLFALQCSLMPTSRRYITSQSRATFHCLPDALRSLGYRAEMFSSGDMDMDYSTAWLSRMYDKLWHYPKFDQKDRPAFRHAAARIREIGRNGPFIASLFSATNHHPFRSPEPNLNMVAEDAPPRRRILNTLRYTDDVLREFIESLRKEAWFDRTMFVISNDHGYNLGEHGGAVGALNLYRESTWTPLLIVGPHPRLPKGRHEGMATLLDIAPTIADLIGLREANPWQGHSLVSVRPGRRFRFAFRESILAEADGWSALRDGQDGRTRLFRTSEDWLQQHDLAERGAGRAAAMIDDADRQRRFNDYVLRHGRLWPADRAVPVRR